MDFELHRSTMGQIDALSSVNSHGWVVPRPDQKRTCAGPHNGCRECILEQALFTAGDRAVVMQGWTVKPGDQILLIAPPDAAQRDVEGIVEWLRRKHPDVVFTVVAGFTGVQIAGS